MGRSKSSRFPMTMQVNGLGSTFDFNIKRLIFHEKYRCNQNRLVLSSISIWITSKENQKFQLLMLLTITMLYTSTADFPCSIFGKDIIEGRYKNDYINPVIWHNMSMFKSVTFYYIQNVRALPCQNDLWPVPYQPGPDVFKACILCIAHSHTEGREGHDRRRNTWLKVCQN